MLLTCTCRSSPGNLAVLVQLPGQVFQHLTEWSCHLDLPSTITWQLLQPAVAPLHQHWRVLYNKKRFASFNFHIKQNKFSGVKKKTNQ